MLLVKNSKTKTVAGNVPERTIPATLQGLKARASRLIGGPQPVVSIPKSAAVTGPIDTP